MCVVRRNAKESLVWSADPETSPDEGFSGVGVFWIRESATVLVGQSFMHSSTPEYTSRGLKLARRGPSVLATEIELDGAEGLNQIL